MFGMFTAASSFGSRPALVAGFLQSDCTHLQRTTLGILSGWWFQPL